MNFFAYIAMLLILFCAVYFIEYRNNEDKEDVLRIALYKTIIFFFVFMLVLSLGTFLGIGNGK